MYACSEGCVTCGSCSEGCVVCTHVVRGVSCVLM